MLTEVIWNGNESNYSVQLRNSTVRQVWGRWELPTETALEKQSYALSAVKRNIYLRFHLTE